MGATAAGFEATEGGLVVEHLHRIALLPTLL